MIQKLTKLNVADNSGAKIIQCIGTFNNLKVASIGDLITVSIKKALGTAKVKKGEVHKALIVRTKKEIRREDGRTIKFDENSAILLAPDRKTMLGSRVLGPVPIELRKDWAKVLSVSSKIV